MKKNLFLLSVLFSTYAVAQKKLVRLSFVYTEQYCGGARPTEEMVSQQEVQKPYAGKTIIFISTKGKADSAKINSEGILKVRLKKGVYSFFEAWRYNLYTPENLPIDSFDKTCLRAEWEKPVYKVTVEKKENKVVLLNPIVKICPWSAPCLISSDPPPSRQ